MDRSVFGQGEQQFDAATCSTASTVKLELLILKGDAFGEQVNVDVGLANHSLICCHPSQSILLVHQLLHPTNSL
jgi:hypothetical protein